MGHRLRRALPRHVRLRIAERETGVVRSAATGSASSRCTWPKRRRRLRFASTLPALLAAGDVDTELDRACAAPLHELPLGGARAADDPTRGAQAAAGHRAGDPAGRRTRRHRLLATAFSSATRRGRPGPSATGRTRCSTRCAPRCSAGWSPTCRSAYCCPAASTRHWWWRCSPRGPARPGHVQRRLRLRRRRVRRRVFLLRPDCDDFDTDHQQIPSTARGCCPRCRKPSPR